MKFIALWGFRLATLSQAAFAQGPTPAATPTPATDAGARISRSVSEHSASSEASERERVLLERIERLERRLNELESRCDTAAAAAGKDAARTALSAQPAPSAGSTPPNAVAASQLVNPQPLPNAVPAQAATASQQRQAQANKPLVMPPYAAWNKDGVKIIPYGILIANLNYNSTGLDTGSIVGFVRRVSVLLCARQAGFFPPSSAL